MQTPDGLLSQSDRDKYEVPRGGQWFWDQASMLRANADNCAFTAAWDKEKDKGNKLYGLYPDPQTFYNSLLQNAPGQRWGYELVPQNTKCRLYCDIEWVGSEDKDHRKLRWILNELSTHSVESFNLSPDLFVCCSSRSQSKGQFKNSYHLVSPSVVFQRNHDGDMHRFFSELCQGEDWYYDKDGEQKCYVDLGVYTKNRCVRLPLCCKKGSTVPFVRISGDPRNAEDLTSCYAPDDPDGWLPFLLARPAIDTDVKLIGSPSCKEKRRVQEEAPQEPLKRAAKDRRHMPVPLDQVNEVLASLGDSVSRATKSEFKATENGPVWQVQCDQKKQSRVCLADRCTTHHSNNCLLFVRSRAEGRLEVEYHCTADACRHKNLVLGVFQLDFQDYTWSFVTDSLSRADEASDILESDVNPHQLEDSDSPSLSTTGIKLTANDPENPETNTYEMVKARFEMTCLKVQSPFCYLRLKF